MTSSRVSTKDRRARPDRDSRNPRTMPRQHLPPQIKKITLKNGKVRYHLPHGRPTRQRRRCPGPQPGFQRSTRVRPDRVGCPLCPGGDGVHPAGKARPNRRLPLSGGQPLPAPLTQPITGNPQSRDVIEGSRSFTLPVFLSPVAPGWSGNPSAFPRAPHPAVTSNARRGEDQS